MLHTDPAGKTRKTVTDAFGRIVQVSENPGGSPEYLATYEYYATGNLKTVTQSEVRPTQAAVNPRSFTYDMLGRLKTATNPESGLISYEYDANGNVIQKTRGG
jgi:YD repeat-containing protein